jgi:hypothetical protein
MYPPFPPSLPIPLVPPSQNSASLSLSQFENGDHEIYFDKRFWENKTELDRNGERHADGKTGLLNLREKI